MHKLADSHVHLDAPAFDPDRGQVLSESQASGVRLYILPATGAQSWLKIHQLSVAYPAIRPAYGLHPMFLQQHKTQHLSELKEWLTRHPACAVGEIGLDYYLPKLSPERQREFFQAQLQLAQQLDLPVILHARRALDEVIYWLRRYPGLRGVVHSFSGSLEQAKQLWKLGLHLGIGGPVSYPRAKKLQRIVATMPLEYLLLETDAPDQPPYGYQGQRNTPVLLPQILTSVSALRTESTAEIAAITQANTDRLFPLLQPAANAS